MAAAMGSAGVRLIPRRKARRSHLWCGGTNEMWHGGNHVAHIRCLSCNQVKLQDRRRTQALLRPRNEWGDI